MTLQRFTPIVQKVASIAAATLAFAAPASCREFKSSDIYSAGHPTVTAVSHMAELMRERSNGRLTIGSRGYDYRETENFTVAQLRLGMLDMARINLAVLNANVPLTAALSLPFVFRSIEHQRRVLDSEIGREILTTLERQELIGLCFYEVGPRSIYTIDRPVRRPTDLQGMRLRVLPSDIFGRVVPTLGAKPVAMPINQVLSGLQTGAIDGAEGTLASYLDLGHHTAAPFFNLTEHTQPPAVLLFSKRVWDTLAPADRALIRGAASDSAAYLRARWDESERSVRRAAEAVGVTVVTDVDREAFRASLAPSLPLLLRDEATVRLVRRIQQQP